MENNETKNLNTYIATNLTETGVFQPQNHNQGCNENRSVKGNGRVINLLSISQLNICFSKHKDKTILQNYFGLFGDN